MDFVLIYGWESFAIADGLNTLQNISGTFLYRICMHRAESTLDKALVVLPYHPFPFSSWTTDRRLSLHPQEREGGRLRLSFLSIKLTHN